MNWISKIRGKLNRSEWAIRLLSLPVTNKPKEQSGLILVQIDGLSRSQFEKALNSGKMPFLRGLNLKKGYNIHSHYSGLPSCTPAVQGELFYGVPCAVPSFGFRDHLTGEKNDMYHYKYVHAVQSRLEALGTALLKNGSAYADVYTGGAEKASFCFTSMGLNVLFGKPGRIGVWAVLAIYGALFFRVLALFIIEISLAVVDFFRGFLKSKNFLRELKFIPTRLAICILLRELTKLGVLIDAALGVPVIHCNFLGYDEQSHRRGPSSAFAHWTLKGIDATIRHIWRSAKRSRRRDYEIWFYSDHGQEKSVSYEVLSGHPIGKVMDDELVKMGLAKVELGGSHNTTHLGRASLLGGNFLKRFFTHGNNISANSQTRVIALGPLALVYLPGTMEKELKDQLARNLVLHANIPMVLTADGKGKARAWTRQGEFHLPEEIEAVVGADHPFLEELRLDLIQLMHHPDSGDLVLSGWAVGVPSITFALENGSHAGFGPEETHAFALLPASVHREKYQVGRHLRPMDLREAALQRLSEQTSSHKG